MFDFKKDISVEELAEARNNKVPVLKP